MRNFAFPPELNETFWTVTSATLIFVIAQAIQNFIFKPIQNLYRVKGEISHKLKFHANILTNSGIKPKLVEWATGDMRDLSSQLESGYLVIPLRCFFSRVGIIPKKDEVREAAQNLIALSNAGGKQGFETENADAIDKIKKSLKIEL